MLVKTYTLKDFDVQGMCKNSLALVNKSNGESCFIHRRVFNRVCQNPELPLFRTEVNFGNGHRSVWMATPMTF